jgi:aromatic amino acid aminotransferase I
MIPLAGGIPSPENFPFESLSATILAPDHLPLDNPRRPAEKNILSWLFSAKKRLLNITVPKYVENAQPTTLQLATSLQYQAATGPPALPLFLRKYVETVYKPAYADWDVLLNVGNTDGWNKIVNMLMEKGDAILVEEWTYPNAANALLPGYKFVPIKMDGEGTLPEHLEKVLGGWDESERGAKRPKVFYTVPTGQVSNRDDLAYQRTRPAPR